MRTPENTVYKSNLRELAKCFRKTARENLRVAKEEANRFGKFALSLESYGVAMKRCARELERISR